MTNRAKAANTLPVDAALAEKQPTRMEFSPRMTVRLKSDINRVMIVTDVTRSGQVRCNWHESGNDSWISAWFDPSELEEVASTSWSAKPKSH
jgi:uncharacterized protein YodC (DUF2158 family)